MGQIRTDPGCRSLQQFLTIKFRLAFQEIVLNRSGAVDDENKF